MTIAAALVLVALVLAVLAAASWPNTGRWSLGWAAFAFFCLAALFDKGVV